MEYIASFKKHTGEKIVLWRYGDYNYQVESRQGDKVMELFRIKDEYYKAWEVFDGMINNDYKYRIKSLGQLPSILMQP